jgi:hypothetical protein
MHVSICINMCTYTYLCICLSSSGMKRVLTMDSFTPNTPVTPVKELNNNTDEGIYVYLFCAYMYVYVFIHMSQYVP